ncbi:DUF6252 family protein [Hymenobacter elongatus]|uniref:Carboxypeptidase regulatory-like domain-containing protein n=1 Tax=Hymenobacter elongatus TaxID=877208 RepID=A0A4Z0PH51_9BACT|nr:DUF6252 family protein [Hymenobacter elongatus]TGE14518.1 hypothetical protein E5J99_15760 [Hymenobacter elongatus]
MKKSDPTPTPPAVATTGSLEGTVLPATALTKVTATSSGGLMFPVLPDATTGLFNLANLAPGQYTLSFTAAPGYTAPANRTITIVAGQKAGAGTVTVSSDGTVRSGTMSWTTDGIQYSSGTITGQVDDAGHILSLTAEASNGTRRDQLSLTLHRSFSGNGTYRLGGTYEIGQLVRLDGGIRTGAFLADGSGTVTITTYSVANGTISGSFGFNGTDPSSYPAKYATVTNGTFALRF